MIKKQIILIASLLISGSLWADTDNVCIVDVVELGWNDVYQEAVRQLDQCSEGDNVSFSSNQINAIISSLLVASYCDLKAIDKGTYGFNCQYKKHDLSKYGKISFSRQGRLKLENSP